MRKELWKLLNDVSQKLYQISYRVEQDWHLSPLAELHSENQSGTFLDPLMEMERRLILFLQNKE